MKTAEFKRQAAQAGSDAREAHARAEAQRKRHDAICSVAELAARDWYRRAICDPFAVFFLYYRPAKAGEMFCTPIIDLTPPNDEWTQDIQISNAWSVQMTVRKVVERWQVLPILGGGGLPDEHGRRLSNCRGPFGLPYDTVAALVEAYREHGGKPASDALPAVALAHDADARSELSFDGFGINGPDCYRSRIATFTKWPDSSEAERQRYGHLFEASPEMFKALEAAAKQFDFTAAALSKGQLVSVSSLQNCAALARAAIAKANPSALTSKPG